MPISISWIKKAEAGVDARARLVEPKILCLGGTTEGRLIAGLEVPLIYSTVTTLGDELVTKRPGLVMSIGVLPRDKMQDLIIQEQVCAVVDATHPYAKSISASAQAVARRCNIPYLRVVRQTSHELLGELAAHEGVYVVDDEVAAAELLRDLSGDIFLSTGAYRVVPYVEAGLRERLWVRALDRPESKAKLASAQIDPLRVLAKMGPFSYDDNRADFLATKTRILVTKESGDTGGFSAKVKAALDLGMQIVILRRPQEARALQMPAASDEDLAAIEAWMYDQIAAFKPAGLPLMVLGTGSSVGKSAIVTGLCRLFARNGYAVAPFKSQNMALNSYVTAEGGEMGRAQVVQAEAAHRAPDVRMNPILLKPTSNTGSQLIVCGKVEGTYAAAEYYELKSKLLPRVLDAYWELARENDIMMLEGAGSCSEINLKKHDLVNLGMARQVNAPCIVVADIDKGGVFAQLVGSVALMTAEEKSRIVGLVINKFRGDVKLLRPGLDELERLTGIPVLGVVPYIDADIPDEDSLSVRLEHCNERPPVSTKVDVVVVRLKRLSNATDFAPLERYPDVNVRFVSEVSALGSPDVIIIPGSKDTIADTQALRASGMAQAIVSFAQRGGSVMGVCGGYQILGTSIADKAGVEGVQGATVPGLGLLPMQTTLGSIKKTTQVNGVICLPQTPFDGAELIGYEIHLGETSVLEGFELQALDGREDQAEQASQERREVHCISDLVRDEWLTAACVRSGSSDPAADEPADHETPLNVIGTYVHGIFESDDFCRAFLSWAAPQTILDETRFPRESYRAYKDRQYDRLADALEASLDMDALAQSMGLASGWRARHEQDSVTTDRRQSIVVQEQIRAPRLLIAAPASGSGKTTVTLALLCALRDHGIAVLPYKTGPDYIDRAYHERAAGRAAYNLDTFLMSESSVIKTLADRADEGDLSLIEGVMGLFDGIGSTSRASSAELAIGTQTPVVLVISGRGLARSASALVKGYADFYPGLAIAGVIVTNVSGAHHYELIRRAIEADTGITCLGFLAHDENVVLPSRQLGLVPAAEIEQVEAVFDRLAQNAQKTLNLKAIVACANQAPTLKVARERMSKNHTPSMVDTPQDRPVIAIAKDEAFSFYYEPGLQALQEAGAVLAYFSPLRDSDLPQRTAGIYLGGGYPEVFASELASNHAMRTTIAQAAADGMPIFAECGGYLYLLKELSTFDGQSHEMCGVFAGRAKMNERLARRFGYVHARFTQDTFLAPAGTEICAHEFHHSSIEGEGDLLVVTKASGASSWSTGDVTANTIGTYAHFNFVSYPALAKAFVEAARGYQIKAGQHV